MADTKSNYDVIILGAGGAGLMCAATAGQRGKSVLLLDHADQPGKKILISGGGRCNFTNLDVRPDRFISKNPHFAKSALARYTQHDFINLVDRHNITWHEKTLGQLFCNGSAKQIVKMLVDECGKGFVDLQLDHKIQDVQRTENGFRVKANEKIFLSNSLVIATGGPSIPKMGATSFAFDLARQFKLKIIEPKPALVPFTLGQDQVLFKSLSGVSTDVTATCHKTSFQEAALFTHKGLSGPAILQISSYWKHGDDVLINFLPGHDKNWLVNSKKQNPRQKLSSLLSNLLPDRLADALLERLSFDNYNPGDLGNISDKAIMQIENRLANWTFKPNGTEGFAKAEVTLGGISTDELSSKTMESKKVPGLYCIGEAVDVTGWLGGYNFQWAWASGWVAGQSL